MKRYHIADVLSLFEGILALALIAAAVCGLSADYAIWLFAGAEICDALDGPCARRWPYPDDGKYRWWRAYAVELDQLTDLMAGIAVLIYLGCRVSLAIALVVAIPAALIAPTVQVLTKWFSITPFLRRFGLSRLVNRLEDSWGFMRPIRWFYFHPKISLRLILLRRYLYLAAIIVILVSLILATSWGLVVQTCALFALAGILIIIAFCKRNRLHEDHTIARR